MALMTVMLRPVVMRTAKRAIFNGDGDDDDDSPTRTIHANESKGKQFTRILAPLMAKFSC